MISDDIDSNDVLMTDEDIDWQYCDNKDSDKDINDEAYENVIMQ